MTNIHNEEKNQTVTSQQIGMGVRKRTESGGRYYICYLLNLLLVINILIEQIDAQGGGGGSKTYIVYWNTSSSLFRIDNTDHVFDINRGNQNFEYDQMNIMCPLYDAYKTKDEDTEKYIIYNVSKEEYETCRITNPNPRVIAVCDKPYKVLYFTITFRPFTPQPGGLEFLPGHDYYFISTSSKDDLHRRIGGRCTTDNMKVMFKIWNPVQPDSNYLTSTLIPPISTSWWYPSYPPLSSTSTSTVSPSSTPPPLPPSTTRATPKKSKPKYHPNEVIEKSSSSLTRSNACSHHNHLHHTLNKCYLFIFISVTLFYTLR